MKNNDGSEEWRMKIGVKIGDLEWSMNMGMQNKVGNAEWDSKMVHGGVVRIGKGLI